MSLRNRNQYPNQIRQEFEHFDRGIRKVQNSIAFVPVGARVTYDGPTAPTGWLFSDGSQVSRVKYAELFRVMGVAYGAGDGGGTTFSLPTVTDEIIFTGVA